MLPRRAALAGVLVLCVASAATVGVAAGDALAAPRADAGNDSASMGTQLSSFMQANSADANGSVDSGMWQASFNRSADKNRSVAARTDRLERRLDRLETRMERLEERRDTLPEAVYLARASRLTAEIAALERSVDETERTAAAAGLNTTRLDRVRSAARNASARETARVARGLGVVDPTARRGPPADAGPEDRSRSRDGSQGNGAPADTSRTEDQGSSEGVSSDPGAETAPPADGPGAGDTEGTSGNSGGSGNGGDPGKGA